MENANSTSRNEVTSRCVARKLPLAGVSRALGFFLVTAIFGPVASAQLAAQDGLRNQDVTELIVLYDDKISSVRATSDEVVDAVKNPGRSARNASLSRVLDSPKDARHMISQRHSYDLSLLARSPEKPDDDPPEVVLQKYVVLTYSSSGLARAALAKLALDPNVLSVSMNARIFPSTVPVDPLVATVGNIYNYQWGLRPRANQPGGTAGVNGINVFSAWDNVRGHAYIAHLDTGIETHLTNPVSGLVPTNSPYLLHTDLGFNFRPQFAYNAVRDGSNNAVAVPFDDEVSGFRGHGTHTAGIIVANTSNPSPQFGHPVVSATGGAGVCWYCSLITAKVFGPFGGTEDTLASGLDWAVQSGAQIVNMSLGSQFTAASSYCIPDSTLAICVALTLAANRDVIISASAGNQGSVNELQLPASDSRTIAVGASRPDGSRWFENSSDPLFKGSNQSLSMASRGVMAPGMDVLSTFYQGFDYISDPAFRCADSGPDTVGPGYGVCTGTSMAAPHVSGVLGLMRSINPQLTAADISARLRNTASNAGSPNNEIGSGIVDAAAATLNVLSDIGFNRLTPLYAFRLNYGNNAYAHFYSTVPQMGSAAVLGTLLPLNSNIGFTPIGSVLPALPLPASSNFPATTVARLAQAWIFTTHINPHSATQELIPLYRLSYKCGDTLVSPQVAPPICGTNLQYVSRTYAINIDVVNGFWKDRGYRLDGIEGYVYPNGAIAPPGTEVLVLGENSPTGTYALYPISQASNMSALGFTMQNSLGRVFVNTGSRPVIQFTVTAFAGANGTISPASQFVASGSTASVAVTPNAGYVPLFSSFPCSGTPNGLSYVTQPINGDCEVNASFITTPGAPTVGTIMPGNTVAFVNFSAGSNGGATITGYSLVCNPGAITSSSIASPIKITGLTNGTTYACGLAATNSVGTGPSSSLSITPLASAALALGAVRSRKTHVGVGPFDLTLDSSAPVAGAVTVEPRKIDAGHTIVFQFNTSISTLGTVAASRGAATWTANSAASGTDVIVTLPSVADNNRVTVSLTNVNGAGGTHTTSIGFLVGDVNNSRSVNSSDISSVKASSGQTANSSNFLRDLNSTGAINSSDISIVKAQSGLSLVP